MRGGGGRNALLVVAIITLLLKTRLALLCQFALLLGGVNWLLGYRPLEFKLIITVSADLKLLERSSMSRNDIYNFSNRKNIIVVELGTILCKLRPFNGYNASLPLVKSVFLENLQVGIQFFLTDR